MTIIMVVDTKLKCDKRQRWKKFSAIQEDKKTRIMFVVLKGAKPKGHIAPGI